jgi:hypothetical protein
MLPCDDELELTIKVPLLGVAGVDGLDDGLGPTALLAVTLKE